VYSEKGKTQKLAVAVGNSKPPKIDVIVDQTTRGPAEILATALESHKLARVSGTSGGDKSVIEVVTLPDGSGYTLVTGEYRPFPAVATKPKRASFVNRPPVPVAMRQPDGTVIAMRKFGGHA
jgi:hypothetical protein